MNIKKSPLMWLYDVSKKQFIYVFFISVIGILSSYLSVKLALTLKNLVDMAVGVLTGDITATIIIVAAIVVFQLIASVMVSAITVRLSLKCAISIKNRTFKGLFEKDWIHLSEYHSGELTNRLNSDSSIISNGILTIIPDLLSLITQILFSYLAVWRLDKTIALLFLVLGPLTLVATRLYGKKMKSFHKLCQESHGKVRGFMQECIQNIIVIKSFSNENIIQKKSDMLQENELKLNVRRNNIKILANIVFFIVLTAGYYFSLSYCALKISRGIMSVGTIAAMMQLIGQLQSPFKSLAGIFPQYYAVIASVERIMELECLPCETVENKNIITSDDVSKLYDQMKCIVFENVCFRYGSENKLVVENLSFSIEKNKLTALIGKSGAGKSTIIKLILGILRPESGRIYILKENGEKIPVDKATRKLFSYVPQNMMILSGTIMENIMFSDEDMDEERAVMSAKTAEIYEYIKSLPKGFNTQLSEGGAGLSQGQIQRLAIARAVYHAAPFMLLDEITASLDAETEQNVLQNLKSLKDKTAIIVSHKLSSTKACDLEIDIDCPA